MSLVFDHSSHFKSATRLASAVATAKLTPDRCVRWVRLGVGIVFVARPSGTRMHGDKFQGKECEWYSIFCSCSKRARDQGRTRQDKDARKCARDTEANVRPASGFVGTRKTIRCICRHRNGGRTNGRPLAKNRLSLVCVVVLRSSLPTQSYVHHIFILLVAGHKTVSITVSQVNQSFI